MCIMACAPVCVCVYTHMCERMWCTYARGSCIILQSRCTLHLILIRMSVVDLLRKCQLVICCCFFFFLVRPMLHIITGSKQKTRANTLSDPVCVDKVLFSPISCKRAYRIANKLQSAQLFTCLKLETTSRNKTSVHA